MAEDIGERVNEIEKEQQAKAGNAEGGLEKKTKKSFFGGLLKGIAQLGYAALTTGLAMTIAGPINLLSVTGTYLLAHAILNRKKLKLKGLRKELHLGNIITVGLYYTFYAFNYLAPSNILLTTAAVLAGIPIFSGAFLPLRYLVYNYSPGKFLKDTVTGKIKELPQNLKKIYKEEYGKATKRMYLASPIILGILNFVPFQYQLPVSSVSKFVTRLAMGKGGTLESQSNPAPKNNYNAPKKDYGIPKRDYSLQPT